ncbi:CHAT domain-containing protein [Sphingobium sp.]|uniref:CHAT domain-containing protein n=1 Tax=Sphingobium sp. TaxID=1912891 RepID=UPI0028BD64A5|nr:CHAT domain-containing protein [Sphingobium sp.]
MTRRGELTAFLTLVALAASPLPAASPETGRALIVARHALDAADPAAALAAAQPARSITTAEIAADPQAAELAALWLIAAYETSSDDYAAAVRNKAALLAALPRNNDLAADIAVVDLFDRGWDLRRDLGLDQLKFDLPDEGDATDPDEDREPAPVALSPRFSAAFGEHMAAGRALAASANPVAANQARLEVALDAYAINDWATLDAELARVLAATAEGGPRLRMLAVSAYNLAMLAAGERKRGDEARTAYARAIALAGSLGLSQHPDLLDLQSLAPGVFSDLGLRQETIDAAKAVRACLDRSCKGPPSSEDYLGLAKALAKAGATSEARDASLSGFALTARQDGGVGEAINHTVSYSFILTPIDFRIALLETVLDGPAALVRPDDPARGTLLNELAELYKEANQGAKLDRLLPRMRQARPGSTAQGALDAAAGAPTHEKAEALEAVLKGYEINSDRLGALLVAQRAYAIRAAIEPRSTPAMTSLISTLASNLQRVGDDAGARKAYQDHVAAMLADPKRDHAEASLSLRMYQSFLRDIGANEEASAQDPIIAREAARQSAWKGRTQLQTEPDTLGWNEVRRGVRELLEAKLDDEARALARETAARLRQIYASSSASLADWKIRTATEQAVEQLLSVQFEGEAAALADDYLSRRIAQTPRFDSIGAFTPQRLREQAATAGAGELAVAAQSLDAVLTGAPSGQLCALVRNRLPLAAGASPCGELSAYQKLPAGAPSDFFTRLQRLDQARAREAASRLPNALNMARIDLERADLVERLGAPGDGWPVAAAVVGQLAAADLRDSAEMAEALAFGIEHASSSQRSDVARLLRDQFQAAPVGSIQAAQASALLGWFELSGEDPITANAIDRLVMALGRPGYWTSPQVHYSLKPDGLLAMLQYRLGSRPAAELAALARPAQALLIVVQQQAAANSPALLSAQIAIAGVYRASGADSAADRLVEAILAFDGSKILGSPVNPESLRRAMDNATSHRTTALARLSAEGNRASGGDRGVAASQLLFGGAYEDVASLARRAAAGDESDRLGFSTLLQYEGSPLLAAALKMAESCADIVRSAEERLLRSQAACDREAIGLMAEGLPASRAPLRDIAAFERHLVGRMGTEKERLDQLAVNAELTLTPEANRARLGTTGAKPRLDGLRSTLAADEAIVLFTLDASVVVRHDRLVVRAVEPDEEGLRSSLRRLRAGLDPSGITAGEAAPVDLRAAWSLWRRLFGPIEEDLQDIRTIRIAAEGFLALVPFDALLTAAPAADSWTADDPVEPPWAVRRFAFSLLPSASAYQALGARPASKASQALLGLGGPTLAGGGAPVTAVESLLDENGKLAADRLRALPPLPDTLTELEAMADMVGHDHSRLITDAAFNEDRLRGIAWDDFRIVALATHGFVALSEKTMPGQLLVLSPPPLSTTENDGVLTAEEIARLKLDADLVILSACQTGVLPEGNKASGLAGLTDSFMGAGARTVMISRWPVLSATAGRLTLPAARAAAGKGPGAIAGALREAVLALIRNPPARMLRHPMFWATFAIVGDVSPISIKAGDVSPKGNR